MKILDYKFLCNKCSEKLRCLTTDRQNEIEKILKKSIIAQTICTMVSRKKSALEIGIDIGGRWSNGKILGRSFYGLVKKCKIKRI